MDKIDMTAMNQSLRRFGEVCEAMGKAANEAATSIGRFGAELHDRMNAAASAKVLGHEERRDLPRPFA